MKQTLIIGAGLSGLLLAKRLVETGQAIVVIEKSRGVGGRLATRRTESAKFDHGAQFYTLQEPLKSRHAEWTSRSIVTHWFDSGNKAHFNCQAGMTALAKDLARDLDVRLNERAARLHKTSSGWSVESDSGLVLEGDRVILTAPLPQALELLRANSIHYDDSLDQVRYAKAVVALIEYEDSKMFFTGSDGYLEPKNSAFFSIANQKTKGVSGTTALTVTLTPEISESLYDSSDESAIEFVTEELKKLDSDFKARTIMIKKWRYSHPLSTYPQTFVQVQPHLFLVGDAFGGGSLNGAARSANALANALGAG